MDTLQAIEKRWGCRKFSDKEVERELVGTVLNAGRLAPSAGNLQDRSFIVVKNDETKSAIAEACGNQSWMQTAPVHIIVVSENKKNNKFFGERGEKIYSIQDSAFSVENMLLAATDLDLGCSLVVGFNEEKIKELLDIQVPAKPYAIIALGYASENSKTSSKYPLDKFVFFEKYGEKIETEAAFGDLRNIKEKIAVKALQNGEKVNPESPKISWSDRIKAFFGMKKEEFAGHDSFMENPKHEEIPRQLPKI